MNAGQPFVGYERYDVRLSCREWSLVIALTPADLSREVVSGLVHLSRPGRRGRVYGGGDRPAVRPVPHPRWPGSCAPETTRNSRD